MRRFLIWVIVLLTLLLIIGFTLVFRNSGSDPTEPSSPSHAPTAAPSRSEGWIERDGKRYYFDANGLAHSGWLYSDGETYYLTDDGAAVTGWYEADGAMRYFASDGTLRHGLTELDGKLYYLTDDGTLTSGWLDLGDARYYLDEDGACHIGWLELDGKRYFFRNDGTMGRGRVFVTEIEPHYFLEDGTEILLVNPWNAIADDYEVELVTYSGRHKVAAECCDALRQMLADCKAAGNTAIVCSAYRTQEYQQGLFDKKIQYYIDRGYSREEAEVVAATVVAYPGTSEHQLGLAVDLVDITYQLLDEAQENTGAQKWLMQNSWRYGFILRYPNEKSELTGIIYEPWHYRYVGTALAQELYERDICLEEYLEQLTRA